MKLMMITAAALSGLALAACTPAEEEKAPDAAATGADAAATAPAADGTMAPADGATHTTSPPGTTNPDGTTPPPGQTPPTLPTDPDPTTGTVSPPPQ